MIEIEYLGQCGFIVRSESVSVAIDPVLNDLADDDGNSIRLYPAVFPAKELQVDYVLCTHDHIDHLALETVTEVAKSSVKTGFIVPSGCIVAMVQNGIPEDRILGIKDLETVDIENGKLCVTGISTAHPVHQTDENGLDHNLAYCIVADGKQLVHLGDTYRTERLTENLKKQGKIDVFFPPINGRDEEREAQGIIGNLSAEEAAEFAVDLKAEMTIPTHFDMVKGNTEDPQKFADALLRLNEKAKYEIPKFGKNIILE